MKTTQLLALSTLLLSVACQPKHDGYTIKGTVDGAENGIIKLYPTGVAQGQPRVAIDSTQLVDGKFHFEGKTAHVDMVDISVNDKCRGGFFLENSEIEMQITVNLEDPRAWSFEPVVKGSASHDLYRQKHEAAHSVFKKEKYRALSKIRDLFAKAKKSGDQADLDAALATQKQLTPLMDSQRQEYLDSIFTFVDQNPSSPVAIYLMSYQFGEGRMSPEKMKKYYAHFTGDAKETSFYKGYMTKTYEDNFINMGIGCVVPDFTLKNRDGKDISLKQVNAKYTLIDFWASWCVPCRNSFPALKEMYGKYNKKGFEIIGVGTGDQDAAWRKAIQEDQTPWIHLLDESKGSGFGKVAKIYGAPFIPTTFLVDQNYKIILRNPSKDQLKEKLNELFNN